MTEMNVPDDLSPEQQVMRALVARVYGEEIAHQVVRDDRVASYLMGAHVKPVLDELMVKAQEVVEAWQRLTDGGRDDRT